MDIISINQLEKLIREMPFYNFNELISNNNKKLVVRFKDNINTITYSDLKFYDDVEIFEYKKNRLIEFINNIMRVLDEEN